MDSQQQNAPVPLPSAQVVGNAFVHQYYNILYQSPDLVYRFYQESSKLGRPEPQGMMSSVTTLQAINEKILSLDYGGLRAEIKTVDAQESLNGGVLVLVTGYLTGKDNLRRNFTQSFFLATQDKGFFVLNDIFRYVEEATQEQEAPQPLAEQVLEQLESPLEEDNVSEEVYNSSEHEECPVVEERAGIEVADEVPSSSQAMAADSGYTNIQEEAPKKSYASIVKVKKENVALSSVQAPASARAVLSNVERQTAVAPSQAPVPDVPSVSSNKPETINVQESGVDGHSVYIRGLPVNATAADLEEEFKRFGSIKPGGVQVRSHRQQGFCFGFIEFEAASSVQSAIEASPVTIGGCQASVEEKRPAGSRVGNRGRFSGRMLGFRNEGRRGRGNFGGGRAYGRGDFVGRMDFGGRGGGRGGGSSRGDSAAVYKRVEHVGLVGDRGRSGSNASGAPKNLASHTST